MKLKLKKSLKPNRYIHSLNVMSSAADLSKSFGVDVKKAGLAGLLHDCARDLTLDKALMLCRKFQIETDEITRLQPEFLLHGPIGAKIAEFEYGINDGAVLNAIRFHTTGRENMGLLDKIIFVADAIEPNRNYPGVEEIRKIAFDDLDLAVLMSMDKTLAYILSNGNLIHPDTVNARNYIIRMEMSGKHCGEDKY